MQAEWKPIETAPIEPFNAEKWYGTRSPFLLLTSGYGYVIGSYSYTEKGKGRWTAAGRIYHPTHWMPLPPLPEVERS